MITAIMTSDSAATGDTVKTLIDTLTMPMNKKRIIGIFSVLGGLGMTTLEGVSGILELESTEMEINVTVPFVSQVITGTGVGTDPVKLWPVDIPITGGAKVKGSATMDAALAINPSCRFGFIME